MHGRAASIGRTLQLALLLHLARHPALAAAPAAEEEVSSCTAVDETSRLRCQLEEARALASRQSSRLEAQLARSEALVREKEAAIRDMAAQLARQESRDRETSPGLQDAIIRDEDAHLALQKAVQGAPIRDEYAQFALRVARIQEPARSRANLGNRQARTESRQASRPSPRRFAQRLREESLGRRLLDDTTDLPTIIAALPANTTVISLPSSGLTGTLPADLGRLIHLEHLDLSGNDINGTIPPELGRLVQLTSLDLNTNQLTGTMPPELGKLTQLMDLSLYTNGLTGTIPPELGNLTRLSMTDLSNNWLNGTIPPELGNLTQLSDLSLYSNWLTGTIPPELGKLTRLTTIDLSENGLTGTILPELGKLTQLTGLYLSANALTGTIPPELGELTQLIDLSLHRNKLNGTIPAGLGKLTRLTGLSLYANEITGTIAPELGNLTLLASMDLGANQLTGTIPPELGNLLQLTSLHLDANQLTGTIPPDLGNLTRLLDLSLYSNGLTGTIPPELGKLSRLTIIDLSSNGLNGTIPPELGKLTQLTCLYLYANELTGAIPPELGELMQLLELELQTNQLNGTIPAGLGKLTRLTGLYLSANQLAGTIPPELGNLTQLADLQLGDNALEGPIPKELGNLVSLFWGLALARNRLSGTIPPELGNLTQLMHLILNFNMLTGTIPPELGKLTQLTLLYLGNNALTGAIPQELGNMALLNLLSLPSNKLNGTVPAALGNLSQLMRLYLNSNELTGTVPAELGNIALTHLYLDSNRLTGTIPPELGNNTELLELALGGNMLAGTLPNELRSLASLTKLNLAGNKFSGTLPEAIVQLHALLELDVSGNRDLTGTFPATSNTKLHGILAAGCSFTSAGAVGVAVKTISFAGNNLTDLPAEWVSLPGVLEIDVSNNNISTWKPYGVLPSWIFAREKFRCGIPPPVKRLNWPVIQSVKLSGNPIGSNITTRDFIWSLAYLTSLSELYAAGCQLQGAIPLEPLAPSFGGDIENTGVCDVGVAIPDVPAGFRGLLTLDLSDNSITAIMPPPPKRLSLADLHGNGLFQLSAGWYTTPNNLEVWNNSFLRVDVTPPFGESGCSTASALPIDGTTRADPYGFMTKPGEDAFQCTTLCAGVKTRYKHDASLNISSLCRCTAGRQGAATNCTGCPADTYSEADGEDVWAMVRTCRPCPAHSSTGAVENASSVDQCKCEAGWYMEIPPAGTANTTATPECKRCKQGRFMDTLPGATQEAQCTCNASYEGLRALLGSCGCADGLHMDHLALACRQCDAVAEECTWGSAIELSLLPPVIKAAYWAAPPPAEDFSKHDIWRCFNKDTCPGNGTCARGRSGTACSLCDEGMYGGPDGPCKPCPYSPEDSRKNLLYSLVVGPGAAIAAHALLNVRDDSRGLAFKLASLRTSAKQSLKYLQMLAVIAGFNIDWPPLALQFFTEVPRITVALPQVAGVACLAGQQTATLEMGFRWLMPVVGLLSACLGALVLAPICFCGRGSRYSEFVRMGYWDVLRVSLWGLALFYSTLLQFGTQVLACMPGPSGMTTVVTFPHLRCGDSGEWARLAAISSAFLLVFVGAVFLGVYAAWRRSMRALVESDFRSSGWWGFLFDDYRAGWGHWLMITMAKDAALVVIATAGASDGPSQLLATAAVSVAYSYVVLRDQPFQDPSSSVVEAWTMMSVAILSVFTAGMGFQRAPDIGDITELYGDGASDPEYKKRERALLAVQCSTFVGPAGVMLYQLLCLSERLRKRLPAFLRPPTQAERARWNEDFLSSLRLDEAAAPDLWGVMGRLDGVDNARFRDLMSTSTATLGLIPSTAASGLNLKHVVRSVSEQYKKAASGSSGRLAASRSNLSSQARASAEAPEKMPNQPDEDADRAHAMADFGNPQSLLHADQGDGKVVCL